MCIKLYVIFKRLSVSLRFQAYGYQPNLAKPTRQDHVSLDVDYDDEPIILSVVIGDQCPAGLGVKAEAVDEIDIDVT